MTLTDGVLLGEGMHCRHGNQADIFAIFLVRIKVVHITCISVTVQLRSRWPTVQWPLAFYTPTFWLILYRRGLGILHFFDIRFLSRTRPVCANRQGVPDRGFTRNAAGRGVMIPFNIEQTTTDTADIMCETDIIRLVKSFVLAQSHFFTYWLMLF